MHVNLYAEDLEKPVYVIEKKKGYVGLQILFANENQALTIWAKSIKQLKEEIAEFLNVIDDLTASPDT